MPSPSTISLTHNGAEFWDHVVFAQTTFQLQANMTPGQARITVRDTDRSMSFTTGDEIVLTVDGVRLWGGLVMSIDSGFFFPVVDTSDLNAVFARQWVLTCVDFNIYMSKLVIRNTADYLSKIYVGPARVGAMLRSAIPQYMDVPSGFDYTTFVDNTDVWWSSTNDSTGVAAPLGEQGKYWNTVFEIAMRLGVGAAWVDANKALHVHDFERLLAPWVLSDRPGDTAVGFREARVREEGLLMVTDALVWAGSSFGEPMAFGRYPDPPANTEVVNEKTLTAAKETDAINRIAQYGRWQKGEMNAGKPFYIDYDDAKLRAYNIVAGPTGPDPLTNEESGLNKPVNAISLAWFAHNVPGNQHIYPGQIASIVFYAFGESGTPLSFTLPMRSLSISFPTLPSNNPDQDPLTYVRFDGEFGISYSDSRYLWRYLKQLRGDTSVNTTTTTATVATVDNDSTQTWTGAIGQFTPEMDGSNTIASMPFTYVAGTTKVYINGLLQRPRFEYIESGPEFGEITLLSPLQEGDDIWIEVRTGPV